MVSATVGPVEFLKVELGNQINLCSTSDSRKPMSSDARFSHNFGQARNEYRLLLGDRETAVRCLVYEIFSDLTFEDYYDFGVGGQQQCLADVHEL